MVNGLHVFVQRRTSVKGCRTDRASKNHLPDLHDVGGPAVLFWMAVRDVLEEGVGVVEVDVAVVAVVVRSGAASAAAHDGVTVFLF